MCERPNPALLVRLTWFLREKVIIDGESFSSSKKVEGCSVAHMIEEERSTETEKTGERREREREREEEQLSESR